MADQQAKIKGVVDMVFLIDATGSMAPCIEALKNNIQTFVTSLTTVDPNATTVVKDWRAKTVGYRDFTVDADHFIDNPFVNSVDAFRTQLASLKADGGGDEPESLLEALYKVASMPAGDKGAAPQPDRWRYRSDALRAVIVFTDASFKETMTEPRGGTVEDVITVLQSNKIVLSIFAPDVACYVPLSEVNRAVWERVTGGANAQESMVQFTSNPDNFQKTLKKLAASITKSIPTSSVGG